MCFFICENLTVTIVSDDYKRRKLIGNLPALSITQKDDVNCDSNETDIARCSHGGLGKSNCRHTEDIGVTCYGDEERHVDNDTFSNGGDNQSTVKIPSVQRNSTVRRIKRFIYAKQATQVLQACKFVFRTRRYPARDAWKYAEETRSHGTIQSKIDRRLPGRKCIKAFAFFCNRGSVCDDRCMNFTV